jgi:hypothetical protein
MPSWTDRLGTAADKYADIAATQLRDTSVTQYLGQERLTRFSELARQRKNAAAAKEFMDVTGLDMKTAYFMTKLAQRL